VGDAHDLLPQLAEDRGRGVLPLPTMARARGAGSGCRSAHSPTARRTQRPVALRIAAWVTPSIMGFSNAPFTRIPRPRSLLDRDTLLDLEAASLLPSGHEGTGRK
jgi:hypothetical protein